MGTNTKTPFRIDRKGIDMMLRGSDGTIVAVRHRLSAVENEAIMQFVALACNAHDALLIAARAALMLLDKQREEANEALTAIPEVTIEEGPVAKALRAAIALAQGEVPS